MPSTRSRFYECSHPECNTEHSRTGSYCSPECRTKHKGRKALLNIKHDHRFCSTCYKPLKVVYRPDDRDTPELRKKALIIRESFTGFQDYTEHVEHGNFGIECSCGNVDHYHSEELLRDNEGYEWYLKLVFQKFRAEGQIDSEFDIECFCNTYWETGDFELSVGRSLR